MMDDALSERQRSALVARLDRATAGSGPDTVIPRRHPDAPIPLSFAQRRLWFLDQLLPGSSLYNLSFATRLRFGLDGRALKRALQGVADRHEALRTVFASGGDDPVQVVAAHVDVPVTAIDVRNLPRRRRDAEVRRVVQRFQAQPFDLAAGPLVRVLLIWLGPADYMLVVGMHHIIADGWSLGVFSGELEALYTASVLGRQPELAELAVQYGDFAVRQRSAEQTQLLDGQLEYWRTKLRDLTPLDLPTDFVRPSVQAHRGGVVAFTVPADLVARLVVLGRSNGATLFMVAVAAFDVVLARWSGTDDVAVGAPIVCRQHPAVEALIGFFVNTLVLRVDLSADPTFTDVLQRVRSAALDAYAHQDLPFDRLVEELRPPRDLSRNPLVQVMFQLFESGRDPQASALEAGIELSGGAALFDLRVDLVPHRGELAGRVEYDRDLFEERTITRLAERYVGLLDQVVHDPDRPIGTYEVLTPDEIAMLATLGSVRGVPGGSVGGLFGERVVGGGGGVAVVDGVRSVTFGELGGLVEGLAARLGGVGVGVGDAVGVGVGLSLEYVVAVLAVWRLGAVVVPVEVDGPVRRLGWVLSEAGVGVVVSSGVERVSGVAGVDVVVVDVGELAAGGGGGVAGGSGCWFEPGVSDRVWVLFTSGSSGRPKGVVGSLSGLLNRLWWWWRAVPFVAGDRVVLKTRPGFVDAVCELLAPLLAGVPVVVADEVTARDPGALARLVVAGEVTHLTAVPSVLSVMFEDHAGVLAGSRLRVVVSSGEVLTAGLVRTIRSVLPGVTVVNLYGSTEISGDATALVIEPGAVVGERIPIGRPIDNVSVVVADPAGRPVPIGSVGELVVGGAALTHGYTAGAAAVDHDRFTRIDGAAMFRTGDLAVGRRRVNWSTSVAATAR